MTSPQSTAPEAFVTDIRVVGVGGGGGNVVRHVRRCGVSGVRLIAANTDQQALRGTGVERTILLGPQTTRGRGAGSRLEVGQACAEESAGEIAAAVTGAAMVFIAAGLGGGTGTGASPVIARLARAAGALTVAVVTLPFAFEGRRRARAAAEGLQRLEAAADMVLVIPNDRLVQVSPKELSLLGAFAMADDVLRQIIQGITDLVTRVGYINVDFSDVCTVMETPGGGVIGRGVGQGDERVRDAVRAALNHPLMGEADIRGARGVLVHFTCGEALGLVELKEALELVGEQAGDGTNLIFGASLDQALGETVNVLLIATGVANPFGARPAGKS